MILLQQKFAPVMSFS